MNNRRAAPRLAWLNIPLGLAAAVLLLLCGRYYFAQDQAAVRAPVTPETRAAIDAMADVPRAELFDRLIPLHTVKKPPGPMDWLAHHPERGQDFHQYFVDRSVWPDKARTTIYVSVLGTIDETRQKIIGQAIAYMAAFYSVPVKLHTPIALDAVPPEARRVHPVSGEKQLLAPYILEKVLMPAVPADALAYIAFTGSDLWPGEGWNFVFGQAMLHERVGVWSLYRFGNPLRDDAACRTCLLRTIKVGVHETGHMLTMEHCIAYECIMNGSNHLQEMDSRPLWLCPVCLRKVCYAVRADPVARYRALEPLAREYGLTGEADFFARSIAALEPSPPAPAPVPAPVPLP